MAQKVQKVEDRWLDELREEAISIYDANASERNSKKEKEGKNMPVCSQRELQRQHWQVLKKTLIPFANMRRGQPVKDVYQAFMDSKTDGRRGPFFTISVLFLPISAFNKNLMLSVTSQGCRAQLQFFRCTRRAQSRLTSQGCRAQLQFFRCTRRAQSRRAPRAQSRRAPSEPLQ